MLHVCVTIVRVCLCVCVAVRYDHCRDLSRFIYAAAGKWNADKSHEMRHAPHAGSLVRSIKL